MASFAEPEIPARFGAADPLPASHADEYLDAHSGLGESANFGNQAATTSSYHTQDAPFGDERQQSTPSTLFSAPATSHSPVSDILRASMSRAVAREHTHSIGHPHSLFGATPHSSPTATSAFSRDTTQAVAAASWGEMNMSPSAPRRTPEPEPETEHEPEPEPFGFESPTNLSTDDHLSVHRSDEDMDDGESDEPEVPETSLPSVQDVEEQEQNEEHEDLTLEEQLDIQEDTISRDQLEYSARAASVILGEDTHAVRHEQTHTVVESSTNISDSYYLNESEQAIVDGGEENEQDPDAAGGNDQITEDPVRAEQLEPLMMTEPPAVTEPLAVAEFSTITTVEQVPLKRSADEISANDPIQTAKRRRRRSFAEMLEADARPIISSLLSERSRRHTSISASLAPETPVKKSREVQRSLPEKGSSTTPRGRGRPRKSDVAPSTARAKSVAPITPKRRGRPAKAAVEAMSTSKPPPSTGRKRGRPSLASLAAQGLASPMKPQAGATIPTGRRGRPRKSTITALPHADDATTDAAVIEQPQPKRRGRPAAPPQVHDAALDTDEVEQPRPKRRGRLAAPSRANDAAPDAAEVEKPQPKQRGRPAKQKPLADVVMAEALSSVDSPAVEANTVAEPLETAASPEERTPALAENTTLRKRGRSARAAATRAVAPTATVSSDKPSTKRMREGVETPSNEPRRKAQKLQHAPQVAEPEVTSDLPPKRRGRPPKAQQAKPAATPDTNTVVTKDTKGTKRATTRVTRVTRGNTTAAKNDDSEQVVASDVQKRRGRPKKS